MSDQRSPSSSLADPRALSYITLADFSPGIWNKKQRGTGLGIPTPPGAAMETNTFRCISLPGGGLGPLPRRAIAYSRPRWDSNITSSQYITGLYIAGPVLAIASSSGSSIEYWMSYEYINDTGAPQRRYRLARVRTFETAAPSDSIKSIDSAELTPSATSMRATTFDTSRSKQSAPTQPGIPIVVMSWYAGGGGSEKFTSAFPDDTAPTVTGVKDISTTIRAESFTHQGRVIVLERTGYDHGANGQWSTNENIYYTDVNNVNVLSAIAMVAVPENPSGYGTWASMSAGELFLVKASGGALTINGDLADPTIIKLPNVQSTGYAGCRGAFTPIGFFYTSANEGAWVWAGGDTAQNVSPQLEGDFWMHPTATSIFIGAITAQHERWGDWVAVSNNWLLDIGTGNWWRLDDPGDVRFWAFDSSWDGLALYGIPASFPTTVGDLPVLYNWSRALGALSYSWQSHPIRESLDRRIGVREIVLRAQGPGTVTVTLTDESGTAIATAFTTTSSTYPQVIRKDVSFEGSFVTVRIQSDGGAATAPIVHSVALGYREDNRIAVG